MLNKIKKIAKEVGEMFLQREQFETVAKTTNHNIVTTMDVKAQSYIIQQCRLLLPEAVFIAEEQDNQILTDAYTWIIDPLDGTMNYAYDYCCSTISIALCKNKEVIYGVVYNPYLDHMYAAEKNKGATLNDKQITVSNNEIENALLAIGTSPYNKEKSAKTFNRLQKLFENCRDIRRSGSAAFDICCVASGKVDGFYEEVLAIWDYAAASLILKEAGGTLVAYEIALLEQLQAVQVVGSNSKIQQALALLVK